MPPPPLPSVRPDHPHKPPVAPPERLVHPPAAVKKPISPPLKSLPYHQSFKENKKQSLMIAVIFGSFVTIIAALVLVYFKISVNVILPVLAPIWVGSITLLYSVNSKV